MRFTRWKRTWIGWRWREGDRDGRAVHGSSDASSLPLFECALNDENEIS